METESAPKRQRGGPNPMVFMDITIGGRGAGRIEIELRADVVPRTAGIVLIDVCVFLEERERERERGGRRMKLVT